MSCPTEHEEQKALIQWHQVALHQWPEIELLHAIPNGGQRSKAQAGKLRAEGVKAGVPDLFLPVARGPYHGLYIEMKRQRGGGLSEEQKEWRDKLTAQGYSVRMCRGWLEASQVLIDYLTKRGEGFDR